MVAVNVIATFNLGEHFVSYVYLHERPAMADLQAAWSMQDISLILLRSSWIQFLLCRTYMHLVHTGSHVYGHRLPGAAAALLSVLSRVAPTHELPTSRPVRDPIVTGHVTGSAVVSSIGGSLCSDPS